MRLYFAEIPDGFAGRFRAPGRSRGAMSAAAWSLLLAALGRERGIKALPEIALRGGKPYFPGLEEARFSLSHTRGAVLCALSERECGCDAQLISPRDLAFAERLADAREREDFTLHELWCLRESVYKLTGAGDLRRMRFRRERGEIIAPDPRAACRLYGGIPGCAAAAAEYAPGDFPERIERVELSELVY